MKSKSLAWPPRKPIEDTTYPTASPLYIDPNPALDRGSRQAVREKKACIEACERALTRKRGESTDREVERAMDRVSCPGPTYRRVELVHETSAGRQSRGEITTSSRPSSTDSSVRRSLTPTRIVQPVPKPWTATVTTGANLYEQSYGIEPAKVCKKYHQKEICQRERICERSQPFREEHRSYRSEICRREHTVCEKPPLPVQHVARQEEAREEITEIDKEVTDLRPADEIEEEGAGIKGEHDFVTETSEEDVDGMHVKKKMTFEKTVERIPSPARPIPSPSPTTVEEERREEEKEEREEAVEERVEETVEKSEEIYERKTSTHVDRQVEETEEKTVVESAEVVTSAVDVQQLVEKAKREEEERKREEEEEERRKVEEEERRRRQKEAEEEEERRRREEEERRRREEEEERSRHVTFEEEAEEVEEVREQPLGRTVVREERVTEEESDTPGKKKLVKETYEEITEEVLVQERVRRKGTIEEDRKKSLREQVQVHQSLRDQQAPKDRRVCSKYPPAQEIMETNKKRVQFVKQTDTGPKPIPHSALQNSTPKEWKSEMVNALTTAPDRPYTPLSTSSSVKEVYTEETIYLDHRCRPKPPPKEELRPISPFQEALMIAPERPYTPLSREIGPDDQKIASRSQTPVLQGGAHCPPSDILFGEGKIRAEPPPKPSTPRPLPTPPPDYRLRDSSPVRSRPQTPCSKAITATLKKPDTIPSYQKYLVATRKGAVESHTYQPSRTPTPTPGRSKSPAQGPPEPPSCFVKAHAPRIRDDPPPKRSAIHFPTKKSVSYKIDEDTDDGHRHAEYVASKTVDFDEKRTDDPGQEPTDAVHAQYQEKRYMTSKETHEQKQSVTKKSLEVTEDFERCEKRVPARPLPEPRERPPKPSVCAIGRTSPSKPSLPCPMETTPSPQPVYSSSTEVRHVSYATPPRSKTCPDTGVTVLPCKAHSDQGTKAGVVVVPCEGPIPCCEKSGVCVVPTSDRSGVCVSPCLGTKSSGICGQPSGRCGKEEPACDIEIPPNCPESGICVSPCPDGSVCVAPCTKPGLPPSRAKLPFPQIPFPYEDAPPPCSQSRNSFEPIHKPRTNLSGQLARLTCKTGRTGHNVPTVQLYKPEAQQQCQKARSCSETKSYCCKSYSSSTETRCQSNGQCSTSCQSTRDQCQTQNYCQDGIHCEPSSNTQSLVDPPNLSSHPDLGTGVGGLGGAGSKSGTFAGSSAPKRGRGILNQATGPGSRLPLCAHCNSYVRYSPFAVLGVPIVVDFFFFFLNVCRTLLLIFTFVLHHRTTMIF